MALTLVSTVTVGSGGAATIEWTNIPQTGKDLLVLVSTRVAENMSPFFEYPTAVRFNSDTGNNYNRVQLYGVGDSVGRFTNSSVSLIRAMSSVSADATASTFANSATYVSNYTSSVAKSVSADTVTENNGTRAYQAITAGNWTGTAAITTLTVFPDGPTTFLQHSTASLYIIS